MAKARTLTRLAPAPDAPPPAAGGNGAPPLDERAIDVVARIGKAMYGDHWIGKTAADLSEDHQTVRRWLKGQGAPTPANIRWLRDQVARRHIARIQRAIEE